MIHGHSKRITGRMIAMDSEALPEEDVKQFGGKTMVKNQGVKNVSKTTKDPTSAWPKDAKEKKKQKHKKGKSSSLTALAQQEESERLQKEKRKIKIFDYSLLLLSKNDGVIFLQSLSVLSLPQTAHMAATMCVKM